MARGRLFRVLSALVPAVALAGCGCSWGEASDVSVTPASTCLVATVSAGCAETGALEVDNQCADAVAFTSPGGSADLTIAPGARGTVPVADFATQEDAGSCQERFTFQGLLGADELVLTFTREKVNRGAFGC
jgi:hypothetical protein